MPNSALPSTFERLLFTCTRVLAVVTGIACLVGVAVGGVMLITLFSTSRTYVSYSDCLLYTSPSPRD